MPLFTKAASITGTIVLILALAVAVLKGALTLIAFITGAIKLLIILAFVFVFAMVGIMVFRSWQERRKAG
jgi:putative effector of murein hydrolase LrgA (UPF0299 family)